MAGDGALAATSPEVKGRVPGPAARIALTVALLHGMNDAYAAFLHPLLPRLMDRLGLSIALAATLAMTLSLAASLVQPLLGWFADRFGRRAFVVGGPVLTAVFMSLIGVAPDYATLLVFLILGGLGSAAFHPPGASMAARIADGGGSGARFSLFSFGGAAGYAAGPLVAVGIVGAFGMDRLWLAMAPMLLLGVWAYRRLPAGRAGQSLERPPAPLSVLRLLYGPLGLIFVISAVGAFLQRVFLTMQPIIVNAGGGSEALGAASLSAYLAGQAAGTLASGTLADRMDRRRLLIVLTLLAVPAHLVVFALPPGSVAAFGVTAVAGALNMALLPPVVVMAQELVPSGAAFTSGIVMGLAWAVGSVGVLGTGLLGDLAGPQVAALASVPVMLVATACAALGLQPRPRTRRGRLGGEAPGG